MAKKFKKEAHQEDYRQFLVGTLTRRLEIFRENLTVVLEKPDHEPVHDLRVSIRRLSAVLVMLKKIGRNDDITGVLDELKSLMAPLGELRDIQVRSEWIEHYMPKPKGAAAELLSALREKESRLISGIASTLGALPVDRITGFNINNCISTLDLRLEKRGKDLSSLCGEEILGLLKIFARRVAEFNETGELADMHRARIALKKFRYSLEIFLPYFPDFNPAELQSIQTKLGNIRDLDLLTEWLRSIESGKDGPDQEIVKLRKRISADRNQRFSGIEKSLKGDLKLLRRWRMRMKKATRQTGSLPPKDARAEVISLCERFDPDPPHAVHVAKLSLQFCDELAKHGLLDLSERQRTLFEYGCLLHDIGWVEGQQKHHKTAFKMIEDSDLPLNPQCKLFVALVARFHRKAEPDEQKLKALLPKKDRAAIMKLAAIIRVSDVLDRMHASKVNIIGINLKEDSIIATVPAGSIIGIPPEAISKKCAYFPTAFGMPITFKEEGKD